LEKPQLEAWDAIIVAHLALDSVLNFEKTLTESFSEDKKYSYEERGGISTKVYSRDFTIAYNNLLSGQVERQMRRSVKMISDFWYTAWIDAGQPDLNSLMKNPVELEEEKIENPKSLKVREHEGTARTENPTELRKSFYRSMWRP
jgi:protein tyrosine phosphatase